MSLQDLMVLVRQPNSSTPITPADTDNLTGTVTKGVTIGGAGNLIYRLVNDTSDRTLAVAANQYVAGNFKRIAALTTATGIIGWGD